MKVGDLVRFRCWRNDPPKMVGVIVQQADYSPSFSSRLYDQKQIVLWSDGKQKTHSKSILMVIK